jgi:pilus assembly protein Flp/PilA
VTRLYLTLQRLVEDESGQDFVEYALLVALVAVSSGALLPGVSTNFSKIFSRMGSVLTNASA